MFYFDSWIFFWTYKTFYLKYNFPWEIVFDEATCIRFIVTSITWDMNLYKSLMDQYDYTNIYQYKIPIEHLLYTYDLPIVMYRNLIYMYLRIVNDFSYTSDETQNKCREFFLKWTFTLLLNPINFTISYPLKAMWKDSCRSVDPCLKKLG